MLKVNAWKIKHQIMSGGVVSLIVVLGIIYYFYSFTDNTLTESSSRLIGLTTSQYGERVERTLETYSRTFADWAREDIFGLSIEFSTTTELAGRFDEWLAGSDGFVLLALVDRSGRIVEGAWDSGADGTKANLRGMSVADLSSVNAGSDFQAALVDSRLLADCGMKRSTSFLYRRWAYNSSGEQIGAFVAYLDWRTIDREITGCVTALTGYGFPNAQAAVAVSSRPAPVAVFGDASGWTQKDQGEWSTALRAETGAGAVMHSLAGEPTYVGGSSVVHPNRTLGNADTKEAVYFGTAIPESNVTAQLRKQVISILVVGILGTLLVAALSWLVAARISRRLNKIASVAIEMSKGDIQHDLKVDSGDEVGTLADAFVKLGGYINDMATVARHISERDLTVTVTARSERDVLGKSFAVMVENLSSIIRQLADNARELSSAASEIASTSEQMAKGIGEQKQRVDEISSAIEEMTATIVQSSGNANEASKASQTASDTAASGGDVVRDTIRGMQQIADVTRQSSSSIAKLASSADEIGRIVGVIDDIADQTNLLALNAAIEAARAGEQGRGFAVVADEVRKLAERTSQATGEIGQMIRGIQQQTEEAVSSAEAGVQEIDKGRALADKAGNALNEIVNVSQQVKEMIQQIASASAQQTEAAEQMSQSVQLITTTTRQAAEGATQSAAAAEQLNRQSDSLEQIVSQFTLTRT